ncbi:MAG TPA: glycosyltransferase [Streptosporangiaceae bacterium]|nr:glycosyltransferase [Streptosporangiaceae bacterium]
MRIAIVAQRGSPMTLTRDPQADTRSAAVTSLARALAGHGHRITIYARKDARDLPDSAILARGVTIEHLTAGPQAPLSGDKLVTHINDFGAKLAKRWSQKRPDVAHAHFWTSGLAALAAARGQDIPVVQTFGSLAVAQRRHGLRVASGDTRAHMEACIARSAGCVLAATSAEVTELIRMGVPRASIALVPCTVDTGRFSPDGPAAARRHRHRLLAVAPLRSDQGLDRLVRMLMGVPEAELVIAGGPPRGQLRADPVYRGLMNLARSLKLQRRVSFTGQVGQDDLPALLRSADLLVSAAPYDPVGALTVAAMACGTPAAVSAVGANRDAVLDETTGLLVAPDRPDLLARRIRHLLATPMRLEAFGIAAADRASARYSVDRIATETLAAYQRCLPAAVVPAQAAQAVDVVAAAGSGQESAAPELAGIRKLATALG